MTRMEMLEEGRKRGPEIPFWYFLDDQGKNSMVNLMADSFIIGEQLGPTVGFKVMMACGNAMLEMKERGL